MLAFSEKKKMEGTVDRERGKRERDWEREKTLNRVNPKGNREISGDRNP